MLETVKITKTAITSARVDEFGWNFPCLLYPNSTLKCMVIEVTIVATLWEINIFLQNIDDFQSLHFLANRSRSKNQVRSFVVLLKSFHLVYQLVPPFEKWPRKTHFSMTYFWPRTRSVPANLSKDVISMLSDRAETFRVCWSVAI